MGNQIGTFVQASEIPAATTTNWNTQNLFIPVLADWGPVGQAIPITSLGNAATSLGTPAGTGNPYSSRTSTCATAFDSIDTFSHEDLALSPTVYASRVVHDTPVAATLVVDDGASNVALTFTAQYVGAGGNGIYIATVNNSTTYTITLTDANGNTLAASPSLTSLAAGVAWAATTGYVTAVAGSHGLPATTSATAMSGGTDNRGALAIGDVTTALAAFGPNLGPGQVIAPNWTNTTLAGIWSLLGTHAYGNNRVAILDMDDNQSASTLITDMSTFGATSVAGWCGFWAGNRSIPGVVTGTTRSVPPSPVIAALCARADATGNPNRMAAGVNFPLIYATTPTSQVSGSPYDTYSNADLQTLAGNAAGAINTFEFRNQALNYGFRSAVPSTTDGIYYQFQHARLRMAIVAQSQLLGQPYVFDQIDPAGSTQAKFQNDLQGMLARFQQVGAVWAYSVDTGSDVNTPATIAAGQLNANIAVSMSPAAETVQININVVPITTTPVA